MENSQAITFKLRASICWRVIQISFRVRPKAFAGYFGGVFLEITSMLASIYATAKLASLLAVFISSGATAGIWFWLWVDIISVAVTGLSFLVMNYCKQMIYFSFIQWN